MRFRPKALIFTRAWCAVGVGLGTWVLMKRASMGPLPPLMSVSGCELGGALVDFFGMYVRLRLGRGVFVCLTDRFHVLGHVGSCSVSCSGIN
jgi:hypothetical protein